MNNNLKHTKMKTKEKKRKGWIQRLKETKMKFKFSYKKERLALESLDLYKFLMQNDKESDKIVLQF